MMMRLLRLLLLLLGCASSAWAQPAPFGTPSRLSVGTVTFVAGGNLVTDTTTGTKIGTATSQKLGFWNATPVVQPLALTTQVTSLTHTAPGTPDYAIQNVTQTVPFGFVTADEANTVLSVILNLQVRVQELETKLETLGIVAAN